MKVKPVLTCLAVFLLLISASHAQATENIYQKNFRVITDIINAEYYKPIDFQKCAGEKTIHAISQSKDEAMFAEHLKEAFGRCLDPHSRYVPSQEVERDSQDIQGSFGGVGFELFQNKTTGEVMILGIIPGSSAVGSGIAEGDVIVQVDEKKIVKETNINDTVRWIRGPIGTTVTVYVRRPGIERALSFSLTRREVNVDTVVDYATPDPVIGYVHISQFTSGTSSKLLQKKENLEAQGKQGMILDLRNDPGGLLNEAVCAVALFAPSKEYTVVTAYHRGVVEFKEKTGACKSLPAEFYEAKRRVMPMVVLVNEESASAAEIVAANLQELGFTTVGIRTYKKGTVQMNAPWWYDLFFGGELWLTIAEYRTGEHELVVDGVGVQPDVEVVNPAPKDEKQVHPPFRSQRKPNFENDFQLKKALEILQKQIAR